MNNTKTCFSSSCDFGSYLEKFIAEDVELGIYLEYHKDDKSYNGGSYGFIYGFIQVDSIKDDCIKLYDQSVGGQVIATAYCHDIRYAYAIDNADGV